MSLFNHPDVDRKKDHPHLPSGSVIMFRISDQFIDVVKFYFGSHLVHLAKCNDVDRPSNKNYVDYDPSVLLNNFEEAWKGSVSSFKNSLEKMFVDVQKKVTSSKDGLCTVALKDLVAEKVMDAIESLINSGPDCKVMFDVEIIKLNYNEELASNISDKVNSHVLSSEVARENIYTVLIDIRYSPSKNCPQIDHQDIDKFD